MSVPSNPTTVVIVGMVPEAHYRAMVLRCPDVTFARAAPDGGLPDDARHAEVVLTAGTPSDALLALVTELPELRWIHSASAGFDRLMVPGILGRGLRITRTAGARAAPMAEYILAVSLAFTKRLPELLAAQRSKRWTRPAALALAGATVGIVGAGSVGRAAAKRFRAFEARTIGIRREPGPLPEFDAVWPPERLADLLATSDVVVLACPLTDATRHMLGYAQFALMKPTALLVNVARGQVVVEEDLIQALRSGLIGGAALDVFQHEPLPKDSPLWTLPNVIVSPHCSSDAPGVWAAVTDEFLANLGRFRAGAPLAHEVGSHEAGA